VGILRVIFALAVVSSHVGMGAPLLVGAKNAVELFYVISGFLISFVLVEKKTYPNIGSFYANRYLRLYPIYFFVAMLALCTRGHEFFDIYKSVSIGADALLILSNTFMFGQDWVMFAAVKHDTLVFATNFWNSDVLLWRGLLIPQAWSIGVELAFYLVAPFVLPRRRMICCLLIASVACRAYLIWIGIGTADPWSYRFFPTELALFLLGALSHQVMLPFFKRLMQRSDSRLPEIGTAVLIAYALVYDRFAGAVFKDAMLLATFATLLPLAFMFQHRYPLDKWIGNLSYPIYICHLLVIDAVRCLPSEFRFATSTLAAFGSILFAVVLNEFIGEPFEKLRGKFKNRGPGIDGVSHAPATLSVGA